MAIAANVVLLRRAIIEWRSRHNISSEMRDPKAVVPSKHKTSKQQTLADPLTTIKKLSFLSRGNINELTIEDFLPSSWLKRLPPASQRGLVDQTVSTIHVVAGLGPSITKETAKTKLSHERDHFRSQFCNAFSETSIDELMFNSDELGYLHRDPTFRRPNDRELAQNTARGEYILKRQSFERTFEIMRALIKQALMEATGVIHRLGMDPPIVFGALTSDCAVGIHTVALPVRQEFEEAQKNLGSLRAKLDTEARGYNAKAQYLRGLRGDPSSESKTYYAWQPWLGKSTKAVEIYDVEQNLYYSRSVQAGIRNEINDLAMKSEQLKGKVDSVDYMIKALDLSEKALNDAIFQNYNLKD